MAEEGKKVSFGFSKSIKRSVLNAVPVQSEKKVDYIECLDEKAIKVIGEEEKKDEPLVIPMLGSKTWHDRIINKIDADIFEPKTASNEDNKPQIEIKKENGRVSPTFVDVSAVKIKTEPVENDEKPITLEEQAAKEILEELTSTEKKTDDKDPLTLPVNEKQSLRGQEESTLEDYEQIPIDVFGLAMLRGMGWQPGKGIGKNEKLVTAMVPELRPKGMGLGADKVTLQKQSANSKGKQEEELKLEKGSFVKIIAGKQSNNYGQVEGFDDDAGRLIVKLALGGNIITVNEFVVQPVTKAEYLKNSKVLNASKYEEYKNKVVHDTKKSQKTISVSSKSSDSDDSDNRDAQASRKNSEESRKQHRRSGEKKKVKKHKRYSSESDTNTDRQARKRRSSSSSDTYSSKKPKRSKKHKRQDSSPERSSKKHKKKDKEREKTRDKKSRDPETLDRRKKKKHRRSRSRSRSRSPRKR